MTADPPTTEAAPITDADRLLWLFPGSGTLEEIRAAIDEKIRAAQPVPTEGTATRTP